MPAPESSNQAYKPHREPPAARAPCPALHSGIFAGLKGGYAWAKGNLQMDGRATALGSVTSGQRTDLGMDGGEVGLFLGFDHYFPNNWVLGIEGGAQGRKISGEVSAFSSDPLVITASNMKIRLTSDWSFDVALRLGHKVYENSLWYVKAGAQMTHFSFNTQNIQINTMTNRTNTGAPFANKSQYRTGLLAGMGVEIPVSCHCSFGAEYNFTLYQRVTVSKISNMANGDFIKATMRPYENQLVARVIWKL